MVPPSPPTPPTSPTSDGKDNWLKSKLKKAFRSDKKSEYDIANNLNNAVVCATSIMPGLATDRIITGGPGGNGFVYPKITLNAEGSKAATTLYRPGDDIEIISKNHMLEMARPPVPMSHFRRKWLYLVVYLLFMVVITSNFLLFYFTG